MKYKLYIDESCHLEHDNLPVKPILLNANDVRIRYFERINDKGQNQYYYWFEEKKFMIILREIKPDIILITSFCVDNYERGKLRKWYNEYRG